MGQKSAQEELQLVLRDSLQNKLGPFEGLLIKDKATAVRVAEPILFSVYGQENIKRQRPYESYLLDDYWVLTGTLPAGYEGGTFLLIMNARNSRVLQITHGK